MEKIVLYMGRIFLFISAIRYLHFRMIILKMIDSFQLLTMLVTVRPLPPFIIMRNVP